MIYSQTNLHLFEESVSLQDMEGQHHPHPLPSNSDIWKLEWLTFLLMAEYPGRQPQCFENNLSLELENSKPCPASDTLSGLQFPYWYDKSLARSSLGDPFKSMNGR
jgi:hypothetical protein